MKARIDVLTINLNLEASTFGINEAPACLVDKESSMNSSTKASSNDANLQRN
jgi:hypothetical protein